MSVITFENICFQKHSNFLALAFLIVFWSICSVTVKTGHNPFPVNYFLLLVSNICFPALLLLFLRDFIKCLRFFIIFVHFIGFLFFLNNVFNGRSRWL